MKKKKILLIGNFSESTDMPSGQHIRSSMIRKLVTDIEGDEVESIDLKGNILKKLFDILTKSFHSKEIIAVLASRSTYVIVFLLFFARALKRVSYVAVGGWLPAFLDKHVLLKKVLKGVKIIFVQTEPMKKDIELMGFKNVVVLPNFRLIDCVEKHPENISEVQRFVYCARISENKGAGIAIEAINEINKFLPKAITLDFFGEIQPDYREFFLEKIEKSNFCEYKGFLHNEEVVKKLSTYDCMLFPTFYPGEGFAGSILEAMLAGIPIIATRWNYNENYVKDYYNGFLCEPESVEDLFKTIYKICTLKREEIIKLARNSHMEGKHYSFDNAKEIYIQAQGGGYEKKSNNSRSN